ncbi:hypothetical protein ACI6PS_02450 [Flavobacterium sp. PLA-1-15]|uniref:hypothetical protein n=1 Tax=Flavobacterium sp. PLA-1-15 TaxID=3380533 RepID=UPI003B7D1D1F
METALEGYKVQFKILKKNFPKFKDEELQIDAVKKMIMSGKADMTLLEQTDDYFEYPEGKGNFPGWNNKINVDLLIEFEMLLTKESAVDPEVIREKAVKKITESNMIDYLYEDEAGRHIAFNYLSVAGIDYKVPVSKIKIHDETSKKTMDLFNKKGKSK